MAIRTVSSIYEAGADRQPGAEPDRGALRLWGGDPGGREDPVLHPTAPGGGEDREGRGNEEGGRGACPRSRAGPGGRGEGGEHARGHRRPEGGRSTGLRGGAGDRGRRVGDVAGVGRAGWGWGGRGGGGARCGRAGVPEAVPGTGEGATGVRPDLERTVHEYRLRHLRARRPGDLRWR